MDFVKLVPIIAAYLGIFFFIVSSFAEKAPYPSFTKNATSATNRKYYDYIIVGGGTAGCALAATLSASKKVLVLERGGLPYNNPNVTHDTGFLASYFDTSPESAAQQFVSTDGVPNLRGRVLGGGSAVNGGFYSRASREYVEEVGWDPRLVNESFEWVEKKVAFRPSLFKWEAAVRDGLVEAGVGSDNGFTYEHLQGTKIGGSIFDENGYRHTAADLLEYADPTKITVYLHATVNKILFEALPGKKPMAYGVIFRDTKGRNHTALLNKNATSEIIVSAGALGSPQLLMLSGIGPAQHLKAHGIKVILDQPMVGQGMSDNPMNALLVPSPRPIETSLVKIAGINDDVGCIFEDVCGLVGSGLLSGNNRSIPNSIMIMEKVARPFSTGYLELQSNDPNENPSVTFNYFHDPRDLQRCVKGMEILWKVVESKAFSEYRYPNATFESLMEFRSEISGNSTRKYGKGADSLEQYCKDTVITMWHYHGGCQMGRVVDSDYRVMGVGSLRLIDSSTFYNSPGTNPQATLMMLGRYMGQKVLQQS